MKINELTSFLTRQRRQAMAVKGSDSHRQDIHHFVLPFKAFGSSLAFRS